MADLIRDAPIGQLIRYVTRNKMLLYPEEKADFQCPAGYAEPDAAEKRLQEAMRSISSTSMAKSPDEIADAEKAALEPAEPTEPVEAVEEPVEDDREDLERMETVKDLEKSTTLRSTMSRVNTRSALRQSRTRADLEAAFTNATMDLAKEPSRPIIPERTSDGTILVDWYTTDDPANPQNWGQGKKSVTAAQICLYTLAFYMGSAIYTPSEEPLIKIYGVSQTVASLGLSLYVLAYGLGPLLFSPLSEIPSIGRNPPYILSFGVFVILCIPTALVDSVAGLMVLRFLQGFFGSPCLATGGASLQDIYSLIKLPYILCIWALAATCGPAMGPVISGFSVPAENWHWSLWEMLWLSGPIFLSMFLFLPETSSSNILLRRAQRLRKLTGDSRLKAQSEIDQANTNPRDLVYEALVRPAQLIFMDPAIGFTAGYVALCYGIYYSFFEAFPLVYIALYGFNIGEMGLTFLSITVGVIISIVVYYAYIWWVVEPDIIKNGLGAPEKRLVPALFSSFFLPVGLFLFGWTGNGDIHWIVSVIGIMLFTIGMFIECTMA
jgi:DHA1 family multidrug resistance protein-like MFS transporter